jgi:biotin carboxylase
LTHQDAILIVGAGLLHTYAIRIAQEIGLYVLATDADAQAPGAVLADEFFPVSTHDISGHYLLVSELCNSHPCRLRGIVCSGGDTAPTVAACCEAAGTPGIPQDVAVRPWNKWCVRQAITAAWLDALQPTWGVITPEDPADLREHLAHDIGFPLVVKPLCQRASRGITLVDDYTVFDQALAKARIYSDTVLLEAMLTGSEHSAEIVLDASGQLAHFHVTDRYFDYSHGIPLEIAAVTPSCLSPAVQSAIRTMLLDTAKALGVTIGPWKNDVIVTTDGPKLLEATARCSGGFDAQVSYPRATGDSLLRRIIQVACGLPVTQQPPIPPDRYCCIASIIPRVAGTVRALPDMGAEVLWAIKPGDSVQSPQHCAERAGFVVLEGTDYGNTYANARELAEAYAEALAQETV